MRIGRVFLIAAGLGVAWAFLAVTFSGTLHAPDVSPDRARATALARVEGTVLAQDYVRQSGGWVYTFRIRPRGDGAGVVYVTVNADRGTVLGIRGASEVARNGE